MADVLHSFGLAKPLPGHRFYLTEESEHKTYSAQVGPDGSFSDLKLFAERGGESVAQDHAGNVYIAAGEVYVYSPAGRPLGVISVPERPVDLVFGGADGTTLFMLTHHTLYSLRTR
jgi:sugar lactone lactonase YvrE